MMMVVLWLLVFVLASRWNRCVNLRILDKANKWPKYLKNLSEQALVESAVELLDR